MNDKPELDFSIFHPLDHHIWEPRCREFYGGWRRHLELAWTYKYRPEILWWSERPVYFVTCRFGRHKLETYWSKRRGYQTVCEHCNYRRVALPSEEFHRPYE